MFGNDVQLKIAVMIGAAALAISQSDRDITDPKLWCLAIAAGAAALVALLRPPGIASPNQQQEWQPPQAIKESGGKG